MITVSWLVYYSYLCVHTLSNKNVRGGYRQSFHSSAKILFLSKNNTIELHIILGGKHLTMLICTVVYLTMNFSVFVSQFQIHSAFVIAQCWFSFMILELCSKSLFWLVHYREDLTVMMMLFCWSKAKSFKSMAKRAKLPQTNNERESGSVQLEAKNLSTQIW